MKLTITLSGFHGTGKSTYARIIAKNLNLRHISAGGLFPEHLHIESEYGLIYVGKVIVSVNGKERTLGIGDCVKVDPALPHWAKALENTWLIAITIPKSKDYPEND